MSISRDSHTTSRFRIRKTCQRELHRSIANLPNMNLQRVDRMTMAHGLEGRVPYLDTDFIHCAAAVRPEYTPPLGGNARSPEKWILHKAFEDLLPTVARRRP